MNSTVAEARALVAAMKPGLAEIDGIGKVLCPPFVLEAAPPVPPK